MDSTFAEKILFPVIRCALGSDALHMVLTDEDILELKNIGVRQSVLPVIWQGLKKIGYSAEAEKIMEQDQMKFFYQFMLHDQALKQIGTALNSGHIAWLPLKGSVLRDLYPEQWMRTGCDIDILVHEEELKNAIECIEKNTDFTAGKKLYHDVSMHNERVHLELHFNIKENMDNIDSLLTNVWSYTVCDQDYRYCMTPEFQIFHNIAHMSYHMVHGGLGIRPFIDLWLLRNKTVYDEKLLKEMCESCGIAVFYEKCCELSDIWMEGKECTEDILPLQEYCLTGGVFDSGTLTYATRIGNKNRISYVLQRMFPGKTILRAEFPELNEKPYLVPYCQIRRWFRLLKKEKRKKVRDELKKINQADQEQIETVAEILKKMGLEEQ